MTKVIQKISFADLKSPLFFAWHTTNKCNLNCIHCLWDSGPNAAWPDELNEEEALEVCRQVIELQIPYVALSGGEPLLYPPFWKVCETLSQHGIDIKIETNGHLINTENARRLASFNLRSIQISVDGASQESYSRMRAGAKLEKAFDAIKELVKQGITTEIVYVPASFNNHEAEKLIDIAAELGVKAFYTGKTMYIGRAVRNWDIIGLSEAENEDLSRRLEKKAEEYRDKMTVLFYPYSVVDELEYRLKNPAASLLLMANGKVKLIGSMPFVCGDVRRQSLAEIWQRYIKAWEQPEVIKYVHSVVETPSLFARANDFTQLDF